MAAALIHFQNALDVVGTSPKIILDKLMVGICLADAKTNVILFANEQFGRIVGTSADRLAGDRVSITNLTHHEDRPSFEDLQSRLCKGLIESYTIEQRYLRPDGVVVWAQVSVGTIQRAPGATWTVSVVQDVTRRKILEQQLGAVESVATISTWDWSVATDVVTVSASFNSQHGLPKDAPSLTLEEALLLVHPEDRNNFRATIKQGLLKRVGYTLEYRIITCAGEIRWLRSTATCLYDIAGEVTNLVGATIDISKVKARQPYKVASGPMRKVLDHIEKNWAQSFSLRELSDHYGISIRSMHNHFAAQGTTPSKYIKTIRLRQARVKLLNPLRGATVMQIALQCGFSNMGHFAKDYRVEYGETPSETLRASR